MVSMLRLFIGSAMISNVFGHGHISMPKPRGIRGKYRWEPQSMGATGGGADIPVCGRKDANVASRLDGDPVTELAPGTEYTFQAKISAHHMGHMTVRICPYIGPNFAPDELEDCYVVKASKKSETNDKLKKFWLLSPGTGTKTWTAMLPKIDELPNSKTGVYTVHWRWNTANSCSAHGPLYRCAMEKRKDFKEKNWCKGVCFPPPAVKCPAGDISIYAGGGCREGRCCSEVFTNCADVTFKGVKSDIAATADGGSGAPEPGPEPEPDSGDGSDSGDDSTSGKGGCVHNSNCEGNPWCKQADKLADWCPLHTTQDDCPTPQCSWKGSSSVKPRPKPDPPATLPGPHEIEYGDLAGLRLKKAAVKAFCEAHKKALCSMPDLQLTASLNGKSASLCHCTPTETESEPEPEPDDSGDDSDAEPDDTDVQPEPESEPDDGDAQPLKCDSCKKKCYAKCNGNVHINQCWGGTSTAGRYIECKCKDSTRKHVFGGCDCEHGQCKSGGGLAQVEAHISTKFSGRIHKVVSASGDIIDDA